MMKNNFARQATLVVGINAVVLVLHSMAHIELRIVLGLLGTLFVWVVIIAAPLLAAALAWTRFQKLSAGLLFLSMAGSFVFGVYNHFVVHSADHVSQVPSDGWGLVFQITAFAMAVIEAWGCLVGLRGLAARGAATPA